jgi:hypothetical protein
MSNEHSLTNDERRQILFSALLEHEKATIPLRERALERVILGGMIGSSDETPYRIGIIQNNLSFGSKAAHLRTDVIQHILDRLIKEDKVQQTLLSKRHAYYLTPKASEEINSAVKKNAELFDSVMKRLLRGTEDLIEFERGSAICRTFICESLARFGHNIAMTVVGRAKREELTQRQDVQAAFAAAIEGENLSKEVKDEFESIFISFLKSREPEDERLKFYVTQGYYVAQLLGLENSHFNPLAESAFTGSVFYLDSNILIRGLLSSREQSAFFNELVRVAKLFGLELRVSHETIGETIEAVSDRLKDLKRIVSGLSSEVIKYTDNYIVCGFLEACESNPTLDPSTYFEPFQRLEQVLVNEYSIIIDNRVEEEIIDGRDYSHIAHIIQEESENILGRPKSPHVLAHDVCLYVLIQEERAKNPKTWFMTIDRTMLSLASRLASTDSYPFCYSPLGFLQSISPFVASQGEEHRLVDVFSTLLTSQMLPSDNVFEMSELLVLADLKDDILSTPSEQIVRAVSAVKRNLLHGKSLTEADGPKVLLEIRKNIVSSADARERHLQSETQRLSQESQSERQKRTEAERMAAERQEEIDRLSHKGEQQTSELEKTKLLLQEQEKRAEDKDKRFRLAWMCLAIVAGCVLSQSSNWLIATVNKRWLQLAPFEPYEKAACNIASILLITMPSLILIRKTTIGHNLKLALISLILTVSFALNNNIFKADTWSALSSYAEIATLIAIFLILGRENTRS